MASDSSVTITLDLIGQKAAVAGLTQVSDAVKVVADSVASSDDAMAASTDAMATDVAAAYDAIVVSVEASADRIVAALEAMGAAAVVNAEEQDASAKSVTASYSRMAASASANLAGGKGIVGSTAAATKSMGGLTASLAVFAAGTVVYESVKQFSSYTTAITKLGTMAGLTAGQLGQVNKAIIGMPISLGQSRTALATAFYNPISEKFGVAGATNVVTDAAKLSDISGAAFGGQEGTSYAETTMMQTFGMKPTRANADKMAAYINATVGAGDMTLPQLLAANATGYFDVANAYGISKQSSAGALDYYSTQGVAPNSAATHLRMMLSLMAAPSAQSSKYLTAAGLTSTDVSGMQGQMAAMGLTSTKLASVLTGPNGINTAAEMLIKASAGFSVGMRDAFDTKIMGGGRSSAAFLELAKHPELANSIYNQQGKLDTVTQLNKSFSEWQATPAGQMAQFKTGIEDLGIELGSVVTPVLLAFTKALSPAFDFLLKHQTAIGDAFKVMFFPLEAMIKVFTWQVEGLVWGIKFLIPGFELLGHWSEDVGRSFEALGRSFESLWHTIQRVFDWIMGKVDAVGHFFSGTRTPTAMTGTGTASRFASGGFMTHGPTAIVGEGSSQHPEFVIPTDPQYRGRALGLLGQLAPRLMAYGGTIGGNAMGMVGSGSGMVGILAQLVSGHPTGALASTLQSMSGSSAAALPGAGRVVESAIEAAVPGGLFRQLMMGLVATTFNAAIRTSGGGAPQLRMGGSLPSIPFQVLDQGGSLPEGFSLNFNGTGGPEPVPGPGGGQGATYVFQSVLDGKVISETVYRNMRGKMARR